MLATESTRRTGWPFGHGLNENPQRSTRDCWDMGFGDVVTAAFDLCGFGVWDFGFQFSVFSFQFSVFSFQISNFSFQFSVFKFQFSNFSFQISVFSFQFSNFKFQISNFKSEIGNRKEEQATTRILRDVSFALPDWATECFRIPAGFEPATERLNVVPLAFVDCIRLELELSDVK